MSAADRWKSKPFWSPPVPVDEDARVRVAVRWFRIIGPVALAVWLTRTWFEPFEEVLGMYWWTTWVLTLLAVNLIALFGSLHFVSRVCYIPRFGLPLLLFALAPVLFVLEAKLLWVAPMLATLAGWGTPLPREE